MKKRHDALSDDTGDFVREHYEAVYRYCYRRCNDQSNAQDMTQETFLKYFKAADRYENREKPLAYLFTIARNISIDRSRKKREHLVDDIVSVADARSHYHDSVDTDSSDQEIKVLIAMLPADQQEIIELKFDQGFGINEIADTMGISRFSVNRKLTSAYTSLRTLLDERQEHE